jgi:hypothetical protein
MSCARRHAQARSMSVPLRFMDGPGEGVNGAIALPWALRGAGAFRERHKSCGAAGSFVPCDVLPRQFGTAPRATNAERLATWRTMGVVKNYRKDACSGHAKARTLNPIAAASVIAQRLASRQHLVMRALACELRTGTRAHGCPSGSRISGDPWSNHGS